MTVTAFASYLTQALGTRKPRISVATSAIFALTSLFYIYTLGSYFRVETSVLHNAFNYIGFFHLHVISRYTDLLVITFGTTLWFALSIRKRTAKFVITSIYGGLTVIAILTKLDVFVEILALLSIPLLILILVCNSFAPKIRMLDKNVDTDLCTNYVIIAGLAISVGGLIVSLMPFFSAGSSASTPLRNYAYELFVLFSSFLSPTLMAVLILCIPIRLLFDPYLEKKNKYKNKSQYATKNSSNNSDNTVSKTRTICYLSLFVVLSATMTLIPHQPAVNKDNRPIGQDIQIYASVIKHLESESTNPQELIRQVFVREPTFHGDRPISLLFLLAAVKIVPAVDPTYVIDYIPIILAPALVLAAYFLTREMTSNDTISILAAFMTVVSFQVLDGIFSTLYANMFALVIGYFSFVFLFRFLKTPNKLNIITYSILIILLLLTHVYTWSMFALVTGIFLLVMLRFNYYQRKNIILLLLIVSSPVIVDAMRTAITGSNGGISGIVKFASPPTQPVPSGELVPRLSFQFASFRANLLDSTEHYFGGLFGNFIILALGIYWLFRANRLEPYNIFIMIFLSIGIVPLFFSDWILQTRVFYNIPFQIPAAIALSCIMRQYRMKGIMAVFAICIWLIAISIVNLSNFYQVIPPKLN